MKFPTHLHCSVNSCLCTSRLHLPTLQKLRTAYTCPEWPAQGVSLLPINPHCALWQPHLMRMIDTSLSPGRVGLSPLRHRRVYPSYSTPSSLQRALALSSTRNSTTPVVFFHLQRPFYGRLSGLLFLCGHFLCISTQCPSMF